MGMISGVYNTSHKARKRAAGDTRPNYACKVPAEDILAMRRMHEIERRPSWDVFAAFPQYDKNYIRRVLDYEIRANLRVKPVGR